LIGFIAGYDGMVGLFFGTAQCLPETGRLVTSSLLWTRIICKVANLIFKTAAQRLWWPTSWLVQFIIALLPDSTFSPQNSGRADKMFRQKTLLDPNFIYKPLFQSHL
jgi:hypothetical protein